MREQRLHALLFTPDRQHPESIIPFDHRGSRWYASYIARMASSGCVDPHSVRSDNDRATFAVLLVSITDRMLTE